MTAPAPALLAGGSAAGNYLTFLLGEEEYGIAYESGIHI